MGALPAAGWVATTWQGTKGWLFSEYSMPQANLGKHDQVKPGIGLMIFAVNQKTI